MLWTHIPVEISCQVSCHVTEKFLRKLWQQNLPYIWNIVRKRKENQIVKGFPIVMRARSIPRAIPIIVAIVSWLPSYQYLKTSKWSPLYKILWFSISWNVIIFLPWQIYQQHYFGGQNAVLEQLQQLHLQHRLIGKTTQKEI